MRMFLCRPAHGTARLGLAIPVLLAAWFYCLGRASESRPDPAGSFAIPAYAFDRGTARIFTEQYVDAEPMVAYGGKVPVWVEYDIDFPVTAEYTLYVRYATVDVRPVELYLDGKDLTRCCTGSTNSFMTGTAKWQTYTKTVPQRGSGSLSTCCGDTVRFLDGVSRWLAYRPPRRAWPAERKWDSRRCRQRSHRPRCRSYAPRDRGPDRLVRSEVSSRARVLEAIGDPRTPVGRKA